MGLGGRRLGGEDWEGKVFMMDMSMGVDRYALGSG